MRYSPDRSKENTPRETPRSAVRGLRKTLRVLERKKAQALWVRNPTPTICHPWKIVLFLMG
jgi:hypothetical protein